MIQRIVEEKNEISRACLIDVLGELGGEEATEFLLQEVKEKLKDNRYGVVYKETIIEALGNAKDSRAVEPLFQIMITDDIFRLEAALSLAELGDKRAIKVLKEKLKTVIEGSEAERRIKEALRRLR